jgi:hypothetical protein
LIELLTCCTKTDRKCAGLWLVRSLFDIAKLVNKHIFLQKQSCVSRALFFQSFLDLTKHNLYRFFYLPGKGGRSQIGNVWTSESSNGQKGFYRGNRQEYSLGKQHLRLAWLVLSICCAVGKRNFHRGFTCTINLLITIQLTILLFSEISFEVWRECQLTVSLTLKKCSSLSLFVVKTIVPNLIKTLDLDAYP